MEPEDLVSVYTLQDAGRAEIIKNFLRREGIACSVGGEGQAGLTGVFEIDILVKAEDADRARKLLESHDE